MRASRRSATSCVKSWVLTAIRPSFRRFRSAPGTGRGLRYNIHMGSLRGPDPLGADDRARLLAAPRPRRLPILASQAVAPAALAGEARLIDVRSRPRIAVWEIT